MSRNIFQLTHQEMTELFPSLFYDTRIEPNKVEHRQVFLTLSEVFLYVEARA